MTPINYLSDFKIIEIIKNPNYQEVPFTWIYSAGGKEYAASFDGTKYTNCKKLSSGKYLVLFKNHNLGKGQMNVKRIWRIPDPDFADGVCKQQSNEVLDVNLGEYASSNITVQNVFAPFG